MSRRTMPRIVPGRLTPRREVLFVRRRCEVCRGTGLQGIVAATMLAGLPVRGATEGRAECWHCGGGTTVLAPLSEMLPRRF